MKEIKFRWTANGKIHYRSILLPDNASQMLYVDKIGVEVYDNEIIYNGDCDDQTTITLEELLGEYEDYVTLDTWELEQTVYKNVSDLSDRVYHKPLNLETGEVQEATDNGTNDAV